MRIDLLYSTEDDPECGIGGGGEGCNVHSCGIPGERCFLPAAKGWKWIELLGCEPISDEAMTYAMSAQLKKWNMDYLSLRADPPAEPMQE